MNDQNVGNNSLYRATKNLNTAMEAPNFNVGDAMGVNIKNEIDNNQFSSNINNNYNSFVNNSTGGMNQEEQQVIYDMSIMDNGTNYIEDDINNNANVTYTPVDSNKKKRVSIAIPEELRLLVILVLVILVFMFVMPNIYDFIRDIKSIIFG